MCDRPCATPCGTLCVFLCVTPCGTPCVTPCVLPCVTPCVTPCGTPCGTPCVTPRVTPCGTPCWTPCGTPCANPCVNPCVTPCATPCGTSCGTPCVKCKATCLCDSSDVTAAVAICVTVQGPDSQQTGVLGSTKGEAPYTGSNMGTMTRTVLAHYSCGEAAEDLSCSETRAAIGKSELIMGRPDALQCSCGVGCVQFSYMYGWVCKILNHVYLYSCELVCKLQTGPS